MRLCGLFNESNQTLSSGVRVGTRIDLTQEKDVFPFTRWLSSNALNTDIIFRELSTRLCLNPRPRVQRDTIDTEAFEQAITLRLLPYYHTFLRIF